MLSLRNMLRSFNLRLYAWTGGDFPLQYWRLWTIWPHTGSHLPPWTYGKHTPQNTLICNMFRKLLFNKLCQYINTHTFHSYKLVYHQHTVKFIILFWAKTLGKWQVQCLWDKKVCTFRFAKWLFVVISFKPSWEL